MTAGVRDGKKMQKDSIKAVYETKEQLEQAFRAILDKVVAAVAAVKFSDSDTAVAAVDNSEGGAYTHRGISQYGEPIQCFIAS